MVTLSTHYTLRKNRGDNYILFDKVQGVRYTITGKLFNFLLPFKYRDIDVDVMLMYLKSKNVEVDDIIKCLDDSRFDRLLVPSQNGVQTAAVEKRNCYSMEVQSEFSEFTPERIDLLLTRRCNLRCRHCFENSSPGETMHVIHLDRLKTLFQEMDDINVLTLKITGGEPLLYPNIGQLMKTLGNHRFESIFLTNGMLLDKELCANAAQANIRFGISLDGMSAEEHEYIRGNGTFNVLLSKLKLLREYEVKFSVTVSIHANNVSNIENIVVYAIEELGARSVFVNRLRPLGRAAVNHDIFVSDEKYNETINSLRNLIEQYSDSIINISDDTSFTSEELNSDLDTELVCAAGNSTLSIDDKLNIYPCIYGHGNDNYVMGNLYSSSLLDIWMSDKWKMFRGGVKLGDIPACSVCVHKAGCNLKNCRLKAVYEGRPFLSNVSYCQYRK